VVTATRAPRAVSDVPASLGVVDRARIEALPALNVAELMRLNGALHVSLTAQPGVVPMASARGFFGGGEAEYVQLRVDGVPVWDAESGLGEWASFRATAVDRLEVLNGPASALYGDNAFGGVVEVFTRAANAGTGADVAVMAGPFGSASGDASGRIVREQWRWSLGALWDDAQGHRDHAEESRHGASALVGRELSTGALRLAFEVSDAHRLDPGVLAVSSTDRSASADVFRFDVEDVHRRRGSVSFRHETERSRVSSNAYFAARSSTGVRTILLAADYGAHHQRVLDAQSWGLSADVERTLVLRGGALRVRGGCDVGGDDLSSSYRGVSDAGMVGGHAFEDAPRRRRMAGFATGEWLASTRVRVSSGLRLDAIDDRAAAGVSSRSAWSPHVAASVKLEPRSTAFLRVSRSFKAATLDQLFDVRPFPDFAGGSFTISNPTLRPQRARSAEAGLRHHSQAVTGSITVYTMAVTDEIDFDAAALRYVNLGRSRHHGAELSVALLPEAAFSPRASYTLTVVRSGTSGGQLKNIPRHAAQAGLLARLPLRIHADVTATWTGARFLDDANAVRLGAQLDVSMRATRRVGRFEALLDVLNMLDAGGWGPGYVLPDSHGNAVPLALPGPPRAIRIGVRATF
jgi:outer membrane cobalamin receptor